jgi:putative PIN family toxin of toxin-antitoxin system
MNSSKKQRPKLVLDTNVWVSAFLAKGPPSRIVQMAEDKQVQLFASLHILDEIRRVLEYEKILSILRRSGKEPSAIMTTIISLCSLVDVRSTIQAVQEDSTDKQVLACAKDASADFIVTGDRHLLNLGKFEKIAILTATSFLEMKVGSVELQHSVRKASALKVSRNVAH